MMATPTPETRALEDALAALLSSSASGNALAREARALSRAADDLEVAAVEAHDARVRRALMEQVDNARAAAAQARVQARTSALASKRSELLEELPRAVEKKGDAAQLAKEINESLRRATAVVAEEVERSDAAGKVVDESSRRLRMTRDQHGRYGEGLGGGRDTLKEIRNTERKANLVVGLSVVLFFAVAFYVARKKVANSNTATFIVRPAIKIISAPIRIGSSIFRFLFRNTVSGNRKQKRGTKSSASVEADAKEKAKGGREPPKLKTQQDASADQADEIQSPQLPTDATAHELEHDDKANKETSDNEDGLEAITEGMEDSEDKVLSVHEGMTPPPSSSDVSMRENVVEDKESEKDTEATIMASTNLDVDAHFDTNLSNQHDLDSRRVSAGESVLDDEAVSKAIPANELSEDAVKDATEYSEPEEDLASKGKDQEDETGSKVPTQGDWEHDSSIYDDVSEESEEQADTIRSKRDPKSGFGDPMQDVLKNDELRPMTSDDDLNVRANAKKDRADTVLYSRTEEHPPHDSRKEAIPNSDRTVENASMSREAESGIDKVYHEIEGGHLKSGEDAGFTTNLTEEEAVKSEDSALPGQGSDSKPDKLDELSDVNQDKLMDISEKELSRDKEQNFVDTSSKKHDVSASAPKIDKKQVTGEVRNEEDTILNVEVQGKGTDTEYRTESVERQPETAAVSAQDQNSQRITPDEAMRADNDATKDKRQKELAGDAGESIAEDSEEKEATLGKTNEEEAIQSDIPEGGEDAYSIGANGRPSQDDGTDATAKSTAQDGNTIAEDSRMQIQKGHTQPTSPDDSLRANDSATRDMREKELSGVADDGIWEESGKERDAAGLHKNGESDDIERHGMEDSGTGMPEKIHMTDEELTKNDASGRATGKQNKTPEDLNASATDEHDEL